MKLPKMYAPTLIRFWSLRNGIGSNGGVIFDIDRQVERKCRRVKTNSGWKWQIVDYHKLVDWDYGVDQDKEILDNYGSEIEFEIV